VVVVVVVVVMVVAVSVALISVSISVSIAGAVKFSVDFVAAGSAATGTARGIAARDVLQSEAAPKGHVQELIGIFLCRMFLVVGLGWRGDSVFVTEME